MLHSPGSKKIPPSKVDVRLRSLSKQLDGLGDDFEAKKMVLSDYFQEHSSQFASEESISQPKAEEIERDVFAIAEQHGLGDIFQGWVLRRSLSEAHRPLERQPCANLAGNDEDEGHCENEGAMTCGQCKLVLYCSKDCQRRHWSHHKMDCKNTMRDPKWLPEWIQEKRPPNFGTERPRIWTNIPAIDTLNLSQNEAVNAAPSLPQRLALAYIGSANLRNVILTVNALPSDFSSELIILLNAPPPSGELPAGWHPARVSLVRSILILTTLRNTITDIDQSAEIALHLWTSAFIRKSHGQAHRYLAEELIKTTRPEVGEGATEEYVLNLSMGSQSGMKGVVSKETWDSILEFRDRKDPPPDSQKPMDAYFDAKFGKFKDDGHERACCRLELSHRAAYDKFHTMGQMWPFGAAKMIPKPNKTLWSPSGQYLQEALASPLDEWNVEDVMKAGIARGCQRADIFGCLYFYLSDQLRQFIRRLRKFKISFKFCEKPPGVLAHQLSQGAYAHIGLAKDVVFDRIDFSDFADEDLGEGGSSVLVSVLNDWSPLLNKENPSATILGYFAEWVSKQRKSQPGTTEMRALTGQLIKQGKLQAEKMLPDLIPVWLKYYVALFDNSAAFEEYLKKQNIDDAAQMAGLKRKTKHTVVPHRIGGQLGDLHNALPHFADDDSWYWKVQVSQTSLSERFVEFGIA